MLSMLDDYRVVDILNSDQLEVGDLIGLNDEVVEIISITPLRNGFAITIENEFGEPEIVEISDDDQFNLYFID